MSNGSARDFEDRQLNINGAFEFRSLIRADNRGEFARHYSADMMGSTSGFTVCQANISRTFEERTFRGMHYQIPPYAESKLISCLSGAVIDFLVDLRPDSSSYLKWDSVHLSASLSNLVYIPAGVANGYLSLERNVLVHYYSSAAYSNSHERGFRYDDKLVSIKLPCAPKIVSAKDQLWSELSENYLQVFRNL